MAVKLKRLTGKGTFAGPAGNVTGYTASEDITPRIPGDSSGGVGSLSVTVPENASTILFNGNIVELTDSRVSAMQGIVREVSLTNGLGTLTVDGTLAKLNVSRTAAPYHGTLGGAVAYYLGLAGITGGFTVASTVTGRTVAYPGFYENVWNFLKQMAAAEQVEIALVSGVITVRELRQRVAKGDTAAMTVKYGTSNIAATASVYCYNTQYISNAEVWPYGEAPGVIEVGRGEIVVQTIKTSTSLESISAPVPTTDAAQSKYAGTPRSFYFVHNGERVVPAAEWTSLGGLITATIDPEDSTQIILTVRGPMDPTVSSWRIAVANVSGEGEDRNIEYSNGLVLYGTGVRTKKEQITVPTGANPAFVTDDTAPTVDSVAIRTKAQAWTAAAQIAAAYGGPSATLQNGDTNMKVAGENGVYANPRFGEIAGSRVQQRNTLFRISSANVGPVGISYTAERDTIIEDFNSVWAGRSFDDFNAYWLGKTFDEFTVNPLAHP